MKIKELSPLTIKTLNVLPLELDSEDGSAPRVLRLCYDYNAIAFVEEKIGRDIKQLKAWDGLSSGKDFPILVLGGLQRFNPEVTIDDVTSFLNPQAQTALSNFIFEEMFPGAAEAYERFLSTGGASAESPNLATATTIM
jgi:hypothetical protein